jgi:nitrogen regulatory protein P-II 1
MKKIEAIIRHAKLKDVTEELHRHSFHAMTFTEAYGLGDEKGLKTIYRGGEVAPGFVPRHKLELIVPEELADEAIDAIYQSAHTGEVGDGRIIVTDLDTAIHIRTGEIGGPLQPAGA